MAAKRNFLHISGDSPADYAGELHLFSSNLLDNAHVMSAALVGALTPFGDIFQHWHRLVPMGLRCDDVRDYEPPISAPDPVTPVGIGGNVRALFSRFFPGQTSP